MCAAEARQNSNHSLRGARSNRVESGSPTRLDSRARKQEAQGAKFPRRAAIYLASRARSGGNLRRRLFESARGASSILHLNYLVRLILTCLGVGLGLCVGFGARWLARAFRGRLPPHRARAAKKQRANRGPSAKEPLVRAAGLDRARASKPELERESLAGLAAAAAAAGAMPRARSQRFEASRLAAGRH